MSEITIKEPQGIVDSLNDVLIKKLEGKKLLTELRAELEETDLYKRVLAGEAILKDLSNQEAELTDLGKNLMMDSGMKKFEALDGTVVQLNKVPPSLVIENEKSMITENKIPSEYIKTKITTSIDKAQLKKDIKDGLILEGVFIKEDYKLVIKHN